MNSRLWVVDAPDGVFRETVRSQPILKPNEVLVKIAALGVNPLDTKIRAGKAAHAKHPLPSSLGLDMAGTVVGVSDSVKNFQVGDEVYGMVGGVGGNQGTSAEYIAADSDLLAIKPRNISMAAAAALPLVTITAWEGLVDRGRVRGGMKVLVHGGAGGVGHVAIQIARAFGAEVYSTVSSTKAALVQSYGATPIDYRQLSVEDYVQTHTAGEGFDLIYDTVGGETIDASFKAVRKYTGHVVSCLGWSSHSLAPLSFRGASYSGVFTLLPLLTGLGRARHGEILKEAAALVEAKKLTPLLNDRTFKIEELELAYGQVVNGSPGRVVVTI